MSMNARVKQEPVLVSAFRRRFAVLFDLHSMRAGSADDLLQFASRLRADRHFAMDFWELASAMERHGMAPVEIQRTVIEWVGGPWVSVMDPRVREVEQEFAANAVSESAGAVAPETVAGRVPALAAVPAVAAETPAVTGSLRIEEVPLDVPGYTVGERSGAGVTDNRSRQMEEAMTRLEIENQALKLQLEEIDNRIRRMEPHLEDLTTKVELTTAGRVEGAGTKPAIVADAGVAAGAGPGMRTARTFDRTPVDRMPAEVAVPVVAELPRADRSPRLAPLVEEAGRRGRVAAAAGGAAMVAGLAEARKVLASSGSAAAKVSAEVARASGVGAKRFARMAAKTAANGSREVMGGGKRAVAAARVHAKSLADRGAWGGGSPRRLSGTQVRGLVGCSAIVVVLLWVWGMKHSRNERIVRGVAAATTVPAVAGPAAVSTSPAAVEPTLAPVTEAAVATVSETAAGSMPAKERDAKPVVETKAAKGKAPRIPVDEEEDETRIAKPTAKYYLPVASVSGGAKMAEAPAVAVSRPVAEVKAAAVGGETTTMPRQVEVSPGVMAANLVESPKPGYPALAKLSRVKGPVVMEVVIGKDGGVDRISGTKGPRLLRGAAVNAVKQWRYKPYLVNGKPVDVATKVTVEFGQEK